MKRTYTFVTAREVVRCDIEGVTIDLPVFVGILKHRVCPRANFPSPVDELSSSC